MMLTVIALTFSALTFSGPGQAAGQTDALAIVDFTIGGAGWGHGIGLSQWGAKGFADNGKTGDWIATYYFPGTTIGSVSDRTLKVNLDTDASYSSSSSSYNGGYTRTSWHVRPGYVGGQMRLNDSTILADKAWTVAVRMSGSTVLGLTISDGTTTYGPYSDIKLAPVTTSPGLIQVTDQSGPFDHTYVRYRGTMRFTTNSVTVGVSSPGKIKLLNWLNTDDYLYGVVPRESPSSWDVEALKAQALVARSYAYVSSGDLYCNTWSQVYNGHSKGDRSDPEMHEAESTNSAVAATHGRYVMYGGEVVQTFFHSSSGGYTADIEDVWLGTGEPSSSFPYRAGVSSPYEASAGDPNAEWPHTTLSGLVMAQRLVAKYPASCPPGAGSSVAVSRLDLARSESGHVRTLDIYWTSGYKTNDFAGDSFRSALGLKSTKFFVASFPVERIAGSDRYETAVAVSAKAFASTAPVVVIASGEDYADSLAGSGLAGVRDGSLLLTARNYLPSATRSELQRLDPAAVYILGGTSAVSADVADSVRAASGVVPVRIAGADRYETAARVAEEVEEYDGAGTVLVASGESWPDAASLSALAYARGYPILLSEKDHLAGDTGDFLAENRPSAVMIAGGTAVLSSQISAEILARSGVTPTRFAGRDRYQTATLIADYCLSHGFTGDQAYIATGESFADALTGGVIAGVRAKPLLLTQRDRCPVNTASWLTNRAASMTRLYILGGAAAVSDDGLWSIDTAMAE